MTARGLIVAAPHSGAGKTTVTLALLAALARRGITVRAAKAGPGLHRSGFPCGGDRRASVNLDSWAMPPPLLDALAAQPRKAPTLLSSKASWVCSTALPAGAAPARHDRRPCRAFSLAGHARARCRQPGAVGGGSVARLCLARSRCPHRWRHPQSRRQRAASCARCRRDRGSRYSRSRHLPRETAFALPERHLGLVQAGEHTDLAALIDRLADMAERHFDLDAIIASPAARAARPFAEWPRTTAARPAHRARVRRRLQLRLSASRRAWRKAGAEIFRSRRLPTNRRLRKLRHLLAAGRLSRTSCRDARGTRAISPPVSGVLPRRVRSMASAAATWCWAKAWKTRPAGATR